MRTDLRVWAGVASVAMTIAMSGCEPLAGVSADGTRPALSEAVPEEVGMSSQRLTRLHDGMQELVDGGRLAGITTMIARHGHVADFQTYGYRDLEAGASMERDAIFRIYSMSKPITGVALMTLFEEGQFRLSDPVARYIPELSDLQVVTGWGPNGPTTEDADHPMTIRELMTHTGGFAYGLGFVDPVDSIYVADGVLARDQTLSDMINKLAAIPLRVQPGTQWYYSISVDVQGYLVEVLSGQPLDAFMEERIFGPLGMRDSGFHVPEAEHDRFAQIYTYDADGELVALPCAADVLFCESFHEPTTFFSGGGGMVSTTMDYMRFCQMMLNGGELDGVRILSPTTVELMMQNQLPRTLPEYSPGKGFGLDFSVVLDPVEAGTVSEEVYWSGAAGTWFWIDPEEDLIFVGMIQAFGGGLPDVGSLSRQLTYQAITTSVAQ